MKRNVLCAGLASTLVLAGGISASTLEKPRPRRGPVLAGAASAGSRPGDAGAAAADRAELHALRASRSRRVVGRPSAQPSPQRVVRHVQHIAPRPHRAATTHVSHFPVSSGAWAWAHSRAGYRVSNCESGDRHVADVNTRYNGNPHLRTSGTYRGKWQFSWATWRSVGGTGDPASASETEQDQRAWMLWRRDGWGQWQCAGMMGVG